MYRTVIFDLDGTLLNTIDDLADTANRLCAARGWPTFTVDEYKYFVGNGIPKLVERFTPAAQRDPATLAAVYKAFDADYHQHMMDKTAPYPGMAALLAELAGAGVQLAVFSNKDDALAAGVVGHYFDASVFDIVRGALPGVPHKPAPEGTNALLKALKADPATTLYVGDSNVDVATAKNAGLPCCGVLWGFRTGAELVAAGADALADTAATLRRVIMEGVEPKNA
ncbi:MAG: HAD family hydrolase [Gemmiger sp.]|nr:HAD family hydrolase [Gemmiger sp.]